MSLRVRVDRRRSNPLGRISYEAAPSGGPALRGYLAEFFVGSSWNGASSVLSCYGWSG
jgi:hypothetical protein